LLAAFRKTYAASRNRARQPGDSLSPESSVVDTSTLVPVDDSAAK
jgi:hypothetical protein